ncbi:SpoIIE family protein phosphatase [Actinomadura algeriensis]|uniref:Serine phosphatase RsbU (Regulator of sigma subunit)/anti-sigma regulatory factor (Ser/Thr protein kinase) n=1 Tax=Actinomadura algeriensis TaxID=1679523 RepID=A0ABR9K027_9ACTN|nr:SpoIIE family protein phosphatase [Actinomadura algeriensis]MBE1535710.1 serine phosphatase RsbU (regulator of sigma subunit)/anti-sigma regulatory factor (Ser/Thr protein kinase) [Actinomadura algeriensis]
MDRQTASATFPSAAAAVADARRFVRKVLADWGMDDISDDAILATSELATNAIAYAGTSFEVICRLEGTDVEIEVRDRHPTRGIEMPGVTASSGRGLPSIATLADSWGVSYDRRTKGVWFRLPRPGAEEEPERAPESVPEAAESLEEAGPGPDAEPPAAGPEAAPDLRAADRPDHADRPVPSSNGSAGLRERRLRERAAHPGEADPAADAASAVDARVAGEGAGEVPADGARLLRSPAAVESMQDGVAAVREALGAEGAAILLTERDGRLIMGASTGIAAEIPLGELSVAGLAPAVRAGSHWVAVDAADPIAVALRARSVTAAPLESQGRLTGLLVAVSAAPDRFTETDGIRTGRLAEELSLSLEKARVGELERSWRGWLSFVAEASDLLAGTLDQERTMALVAQLVVPRLATWCAVYTVADAEPARLAYVWHADENRADGLRALLDEAGPAPATDVPGPWHGFADAPADVRAAAGDTAADQVYAFPLIARGRRTGTILIGRPAGDRFARSAIELAEELSRRAALAVDNARLFSAQTAMSSALQRSLLPPAIPEIPGLEVAVVYEPAGEGSEVGGDFYDVFESGPVRGGPALEESASGRWRFAIGDVCGTGPEAAAVTGLARHALRILAAENMSVPGVLGRLNRLILGEGERGRLLTLLHGEITPRRARDGVTIRLSSAGHPPPLILDPGGEVREAASSQPLLGVFDDVDFHTDTVELRRGEVLLCVTDGVTERRSGGRLLGDGNGLERLLAGCTGLSAGAVAARIQRAVRDFGPEPSNDDVALIVLRAS